MSNQSISKILFLTWGLVLFSCNGVAFAQEEKQDDPTSESSVIQETLKTIKEVEKLDQYLQQNQQLKNENKSLKEQIASLSKQIKQLTEQINTQNERLRKQLLSLPKFEIRSKVIGVDSAQAILRFGDQDVRIRDNMQMSVPVENGLWTLMKVEKITKEVVELNFIELERTVTLYD